MKLWIIGKRGMLTEAFQRKCKEKRIDYVATSRKELDVTRTSAVKAQFETLHFTHVVNCSGYTAVDRAEEEKLQQLHGQLLDLLNKHDQIHQDNGNRKDREEA